MSAGRARFRAVARLSATAPAIEAELLHQSSQRHAALLGEFGQRLQPPHVEGLHLVRERQ